MQAFLNSVAGSPALALLGGLIVVALFAAPIALKLAGLSGSQIVALLKYTAETVVALVRAYRCTDSTEPFYEEKR